MNNLSKRSWLSCDVVGVSYACHSSVGAARGFWRRLILHASHRGSAKKTL